MFINDFSLRVVSFVQGQTSGRPMLIMLFPLAGPACGQEFQPASGLQNYESRIYTSDSMQEIAVCKVRKIFLDCRKLGFFKVKLLPGLVVLGVRVDFAEANPTNEWAAAFQSDWLPEVKRSGVEWREVSLASQKTGAPRLHAVWVQPVSAGTPTVCAFKGVPLGSQRSEMAPPQAELRDEEGHPCVVWNVVGGERHLDMFSRKIFDNLKSDGGEK